jgi:type I restriction enzyme M protein
MEGEIVRGNSMTNPKFRDSDTSLRKFDIAVANPMWNQPFEESVYENDPFSRFEEQGGITTSKADWAWLQHTLASLKATGRAAVVLDTGAVTRGSGNKTEDREKKIRKWFVEQDAIEGVILLPDNLFYNTTAPGVIIVLNRQKPKLRQGKIVLVNASGEFKKGQPKNFIPEAGIQKIADAFIAGEDVPNFVKIISAEEAAKNDYNLSPSRYVGTATDETYREIPEIVSEMRSLEQKAAKITKDLDGILQQLNLSAEEKP